MKLVYTVLVLAALVYAERRLIEPRLTGARLSALVQAALVYTVLVYQEWIRCHIPTEGCLCKKINIPADHKSHLIHCRWTTKEPFDMNIININNNVKISPCMGTTYIVIRINTCVILYIVHMHVLLLQYVSIYLSHTNILKS